MYLLCFCHVRALCWGLGLQGTEGLGTVPEMRAFPANGRAQTSTLENISCQAGENVNPGEFRKKKSGSVRGGQERWASEEGQHGGTCGRGSALSRLGAELELRRSGSSLGPSQ